jgi:hypothetical protein
MFREDGLGLHVDHGVGRYLCASPIATYPTSNGKEGTSVPDYDHKKLAAFLAQKAKNAALGEGFYESPGNWTDHTPKGKDLATLKAGAQAKREQKNFTFQKPMADRTEKTEEKPPKWGGNRVDAKPFANEQYAGKVDEVAGISADEIKAIQARGPARDAEGRLTGEETKAVAPVVPTRSQATYLHAGLKRDKKDPSKSEYDKEETEKGDWRKVPDGATGIKTPYYHGDEQEAHRVKVGEGGKLTKAGKDFDTSGAKGGRMEGSTEGREIFAMDTKGGIFTTDPKRTTDPNTGIVDDPHHSSLVHGEKTTGDGEFETYRADTVDKGKLKAVSDVSGHYVPKPGHTADVINELEAQGASMIGEGGKRARVELSYNERGDYITRKLGKGETKPDEIPIDEMMSRTPQGAVTMDFERFSQSGGNLPRSGISGKSAKISSAEGSMNRARSSRHSERRTRWRPPKRRPARKRPRRLLFGRKRVLRSTGLRS